MMAPFLPRAQSTQHTSSALLFLPTQVSLRAGNRYLAQRSLPPRLSEPFAGVMRRTCGLREVDSWFEGSRAPSLSHEPTVPSLAALRSHHSLTGIPCKSRFSPFVGSFRGLREIDSWSEGNGTWFEGNRLVVWG